MFQRRSVPVRLLALTAFCFAPPLLADSDTIVVTATRQAQRAEELLSDVSVITSEDIKASGQSSLPELLSHQAGVQFSVQGSPGNPASLFIRGTNSNHTVVIIDGIRIGSATLGSASLSQIPLAQIDRIEILKGPASALYGADALGGVVQIFTKPGSKKNLGFDLEAAYGTYNTTKVATGFYGGSDGWQYSLRGSIDQSDAFSSLSTPRGSAFGYNGYDPDKDGYKNSALSGNLAYRLNSDHEIGLNVFYNNGQNKYDAAGTSPQKPIDYRSETLVQNTSLYARSQWLPAWSSTLRIGQSTDLYKSFTGTRPSSHVRTDQNQFSWQHDIKLPLGTGLIALERLSQRLEASTTYAENDRNITSILGGWTAQAHGHRWQINARYDDIERTGRKTTGLGAYGYQFTDFLRAQASYGTAYKAPSFNDLYYPTSSWSSGNPTLRPEFSRNQEIALYFDHPRHSASITYFHNRIQDLIEWREVPAGSWFYTPVNVNTALIQGTSLTYTGHFGGLSLRSHLDFLNPRDETTNHVLARRAKRYGGITADYLTGPWTLKGELVASGSRFSDPNNTVRLGGYTLVNVGAQYKIDEHVSSFVRINNLFNKRYELVQDYGVAGFTLLVGVRFQP